MGFPVADGMFPLISPQINGLYASGSRKVVYVLFSILGMDNFLEQQMASYSSMRYEFGSSGTELLLMSVALICELLPAVKFSDLAGYLEYLPENCDVCLYELGGDYEIRQLGNCRHVFHRCCLDRWMDHDQKTWPLCRTQFISEDMQETFN